MLSTQDILNTINNMQSNAQLNLPTIPNNGNPAGANNMPTNTGVVPPSIPQNGYNMPSWLNPSPNMDTVQQMLAQFQPPNTPAGGNNTGLNNHPGWDRLQAMGYTGPMPGTPEFQAARAAGQHPILDWLHSQHPEWGIRQQAPTLPTGVMATNPAANQPSPVLPQSGGFMGDTGARIPVPLPMRMRPY
jgi:hypothetical protein